MATLSYRHRRLRDRFGHPSDGRAHFPLYLFTAMAIDDYVLRKATPADAVELSALATRTFTATFGELFTDEDLSAFLTTAYAVDRVRSEIEDPQRHIVLAFQKDNETTPCGYSMLHDGSLRPGDEDQDPKDYLELKRLYVEDTHHGKGTARLLMDHMMDIIHKKNRKVTWIGAWYRSFRAHAFYKKYGFVETGKRMFIVGKTQNPSFVFTLRTDEAPQA